MRHVDVVEAGVDPEEWICYWLVIIWIHVRIQELDVTGKIKGELLMKWQFNVVQEPNVHMLSLICWSICCFYSSLCFFFVFFARQMTRWKKEDYDLEDGKSSSRPRQGNVFTTPFHGFPLCFINLWHIYFNQGCVLDRVLNIHSCWFQFQRGVSSVYLAFLFFFFVHMAYFVFALL